MREFMNVNINALNRVFTKQVINSLVENDDNTKIILENIIKHYLSDMHFKKNVDIITRIYLYMSKNYRNEYFYINTLLNKLLLGRHSLSTTTAITQLPIASSKADFILLNGKAVVYEVKTELDTFGRLEYQLNDYYKAFTYVNVITCESNYFKLNKMLKDTPTGICVLSEKNTIRTKKEAQYSSDHLDKQVIFKILRKYEFENMIMNFYKKLPQATPAFYYDECFKLFEKIPLDALYSSFIRQIKNRNKVLDLNSFNSVPYELKSYAYFSNLKSSEYHNIFNFLNRNYKEENECIIHM